MRDEQKEANAELATSDSQEAIARSNRADQAMRQFFDQNQDAVSPVDHEVAKTSHYRMLRLNQVSNVVENATDEGGGINGLQVMNGLKRLQQQWGVGTEGRSTMQDVLGPTVLDNLENLAKANLTRAGRDSMKALQQNVVLKLAGNVMSGAGKIAIGAEAATHLLGLPTSPLRMTTAASAATYMAGRKLLQMMETNPRIGNAAVWAIENRVKPEIYTPIISRLVSNAASQLAIRKASDNQEQTQ